MARVALLLLLTVATVGSTVRGVEPRVPQALQGGPQIGPMHPSGIPKLPKELMG